MNHFPELNYLIQKVEKVFGHAPSVPKDFELLSEAVSTAVKQAISSSTLKRLWGYDNYASTPRPDTLDILARYAGYMGFREFVRQLREDPVYTSGFLSPGCLEASSLMVGEQLQIGWNPNRLLKLEYLGNNRFHVLESRNATLKEGDRFEALAFFKGFPMILPSVERGEDILPMYMAGAHDGLTIVEKLK